MHHPIKTPDIKTPAPMCVRMNVIPFYRIYSVIPFMHSVILGLDPRIYCFFRFIDFWILGSSPSMTQRFFLKDFLYMIYVALQWIQHLASSSCLTRGSSDKISKAPWIMVRKGIEL
jgi:hypothetical protein